MSYADIKFKELLSEILENGTSSEGDDIRAVWDDTKQPAHATKKFFTTIEYDLSKEFPIHTLRPTPFRSCINELLWIWKLKSNNVNILNSMNKNNRGIWDAWADETGYIGKAYGYQLGIVSKYKEGYFDQVDRLLYDLKNNRASRRIMTNIYNHEYLHEMNLYPCVYNCVFDVDNGKLNMALIQRSADLIVAGGWNLTQYAILMHMLAQVSDLKVGTLAHVLINAHIYDRHIEIAKELIEREPYPAPKFIINKDIKNFYDFTVDDFKLENYQKHPQIENIPVAK